jgi:hypothetical protein
VKICGLRSEGVQRYQQSERQLATQQLHDSPPERALNFSVDL